MFANLYVFSGSNHLFGAPTGILFNHLTELAGGVVRVDSTNSTFINIIHPHEKSVLHSARLKKWLAEVGHTARQFGPYGSRVTGRQWAPRPTDLPDEEMHFTPYLIPMVELRRLIHEALDVDQTFTLSTYNYKVDCMSYFICKLF